MNSPHGIALLLACVAGPVAAADFEEETLPALSALLPTEMRQSVHHSVEDVAVEGRFYSFSLDSEFGTVIAPSLALLRTRVQEIETLSQAVNQFGAPAEVPEDMSGGQFSVRGDSAIDILTDPVSTAGNLAGQVADGLHELGGGGAPAGAGGDPYGAVSGDPGLAMHRRNIAAQWGLDPYSSNRRVQEFLETAARARAGGRIASGAPSIIASSRQRLSVEDAAVDTVVAGALKAETPEQLRTRNARSLAAMQVRADLAQRFLDHPAYSPRHRTRICAYLELLDGVFDRGAFIEAALQADDERMVTAFEQAAMMLAHYHRNAGALLKLHAGDNLLEAVGADRRMVYFAPVDVIFWNRRTAEMFDRQLQRDREAGFAGWELVVAGSLSARARSALDALGYTLRDHYVR